MTRQAKLERARVISEQLGIFFKSTPVPTIVVLPNGAFVAANDGAIRQYGYALAELLEMRVHDLHHGTHPIDVDLASVTRGPVPLLPRQHTRKDGTRLWVVPTAGPVSLDGETLIVSALKDVTALVDAEARERVATEARLADRQLVLSAVMALLAERQIDPALPQLASAFADAVGGAASLWLPETESPGLLRVVASSRTSPDVQRVLAEDTIELDVETFAGRAWASGRTFIVRQEAARVGSVEARSVAGAQSLLVVAPLVGRAGTYGLLYGRMHPDSDAARASDIAATLGSFGGIVLEAAQLEASAKREHAQVEEIWEAAFERLGDGVALIDRSGKILRVNSALQAFSGSRTLVGKSCRDVLRPCRASEGPCDHQIAVDERRRVTREVLEPLSGRPLRIEVIPTRHGDGFASVHLVRDLSHERAQRSQLANAERFAAIGRLAAGVAHEVSNPAAVVTVNLGVLKARFAAGSTRPLEVLAMLDESLSSMENIRDIIADLKSVSREKARALTDLSAIANTALRMAAHETRGRARVEKVLEDGVLVRARSARIAQVVLNLILQAAAAIQGNSSPHTIEVRTRREGAKARIEIEDTCGEVSPAIAEHIFAPFAPAREGSSSSGLGLWLARDIVEEEGGSLTFRHAARGALFTLELPAATTSSSTIDATTTDKGK